MVSWRVHLTGFVLNLLWSCVRPEITINQIYFCFSTFYRMPIRKLAVSTWNATRNSTPNSWVTLPTTTQLSISLAPYKSLTSAELDDASTNTPATNNGTKHPTTVADITSMEYCFWVGCVCVCACVNVQWTVWVCGRLWGNPKWKKSNLKKL